MNEPLTGFYDLSLCPPTYDFVSFLQHLECRRIALAFGRCRVVLLRRGAFGGFRQDKWWPYTVAEREALLRNVVEPLCRLLPSCAGCETRNAPDPNRTVSAHDVGRASLVRNPLGNSIGFGARHYGLRVCVEAMRETGPRLRAPDPRPDPRLVTITLRECEHWPERNSRVDEWIIAAGQIEARGYRVVFVRDTLQAQARISGFECDARAATDVVMRANLYASAACNLSVSNGPAWLAFALGAPLLLFRPVNDASTNPAVHTAFFARCGIPPGGQVPGALPSQRLVWSSDDSVSILGAFDRHMALAEAG